jgi:plasmid replication initiation protein
MSAKQDLLAIIDDLTAIVDRMEATEEAEQPPAVNLGAHIAHKMTQDADSLLDDSRQERLEEALRRASLLGVALDSVVITASMQPVEKMTNRLTWITDNIKNGLYDLQEGTD